MTYPASKFDRALQRLTEWVKDEGGGGSVSDAVKRLGLDRTRIIQLIADETLASRKLENLVVISRRSLEEYAAMKGLQADGSSSRKEPQFAPWADVFLAALGRGERVMEAAETARVSREAVYALRRREAGFAAAWDEAITRWIGDGAASTKAGRELEPVRVRK